MNGRIRYARMQWSLRATEREREGGRETRFHSTFVIYLAQHKDQRAAVTDMYSFQMALGDALSIVLIQFEFPCSLCIGVPCKQKGKGIA